MCLFVRIICGVTGLWAHGSDFPIDAFLYRDPTKYRGLYSIKINEDDFHSKGELKGSDLPVTQLQPWSCYTKSSRRPGLRWMTWTIWDKNTKNYIYPPGNWHIPLEKRKNHWTSSKVPLKGEGNYLSCREGRWNWGLLLGPRIFRGIRHFSRSQMLETLHIIGALRHWILHHGL